MSLSHIAIPAQELQTIWKSRFYNITIKLGASPMISTENLAPFRIPPAVNMVNGKEFHARLFAANALITIMGKNLFPDFVSALLVRSLSFITVIGNPFMVRSAKSAFLFFSTMSAKCRHILLARSTKKFIGNRREFPTASQRQSSLRDLYRAFCPMDRL